MLDFTGDLIIFDIVNTLPKIAVSQTEWNHEILRPHNSTPHGEKDILDSSILCCHSQMFAFHLCRPLVFIDLHSLIGNAGSSDQVLLQNIHDLIQVYRLPDVPIHSRIQAFFNIFFKCICGHGDNRDCFRALGVE